MEFFQVIVDARKGFCPDKGERTYVTTHVAHSADPRCAGTRPLWRVGIFEPIDGSETHECGPLRASAVDGGALMPGKAKHSEKWDRCWADVQAKGHSSDSAAAICTAQLKEESYEDRSATEFWFRDLEVVKQWPVKPDEH
jgi:hypothetical protein